MRKPLLRLSKSKLEVMIEEATVDCYNESEEAGGSFTMIETNLKLPFETNILGGPAVVERVDMNRGNQIVAICRRGKHRQAVPILGLPLPSPLPAGMEWNGMEWIEAYRHWSMNVDK